MKLYGFWRSLATYRVRVALALKGVEAHEVSVNLLKGMQHGDDYKAVNPQCVVPSLLIDDGPPLVQSMAILEYLEETHPQPPLLPRDPRGPGFCRGIFQRRDHGDADRHAHLRRVHENRRFRPGAAAQAARRTEEPHSLASCKPASIHEEERTWDSPAGESSRQPASAW